MAGSVVLQFSESLDEHTDKSVSILRSVGERGQRGVKKGSHLIECAFIHKHGCYVAPPTRGGLQSVSALQSNQMHPECCETMCSTQSFILVYLMREHCLNVTMKTEIKP